MKISYYLIVILLVLSVLFTLSGCYKFTSFKEDGNLKSFKIGKMISIIIEETEVVDAEFLQKVFNNEIKKDTPYFNLWDDAELSKLIKYMSVNNYVIVPGIYTFNQAWGFEDGLFIIKWLDENSKSKVEKREILKFQKK